MNFFNVFLSLWPIYRPVWVVANSMSGWERNDSMYIDFYAIYRFLIKYKYTPGLTSIVFKQSSKYIKAWYFSQKTEDHQLRKMVLQMVSIHYCAADFHGMYQKVYP